MALWIESHQRHNGNTELMSVCHSLHLQALLFQKKAPPTLSPAHRSCSLTWPSPRLTTSCRSTPLLPLHCMDAVKTHEQASEAEWWGHSLRYRRCRTLGMSPAGCQTNEEAPSKADQVAKSMGETSTSPSSISCHHLVALLFVSSLSVVTKRWGEFSAANESWCCYVRGKSNTAQPVRTWLWKQRVSAPTPTTECGLVSGEVPWSPPVP